MVQLNEESPIYIFGKEGTNTQLDFVKFIVKCLDDQQLQNGDILICDNAAIHAAADSLILLDDLLRAANVRIVLLPAYSPELNPCELVFGYVKRYLRESHQEAIPLELRIAFAFNLVTYDMIVKYYNKCIQI